MLHWCQFLAWLVKASTQTFVRYLFCYCRMFGQKNLATLAGKKPHAH